MDKIVAIIPARGGSKRIPQKNIRPFIGQPIIKYSIDAAIKSKLFSEIMVSTDSQEIADLSLSLGAKVPFVRSRENSDDYATTADVLVEVLEKYMDIGGQFDFACCIYPTAPFVNAEKLQEGFKLLKKSKADALIPVVRFNYPIQRALKINNGQLIRMCPEFEKSRSQDLESAFHDAGQFYWLKVNSFINNKSLLSGKTIPMIIPELEVQDIDDENDWAIAEFKFRYQQ